MIAAGHRVALCCPLCPQLFIYFSYKCLVLYFIFIQIITLSSCSIPQDFFPLHPNKSCDYLRVSVHRKQHQSFLMVNQTHVCSKALLPATLEPADHTVHAPRLLCDSGRQEAGDNWNWWLRSLNEGAIYKGVGSGQGTSLGRGHQGQYHLACSFYPVPRGCVTCPGSHSKRQSHWKTKCLRFQWMKQNKNFPGGPLADSKLPMHGAWVWFLVGELGHACHY